MMNNVARILIHETYVSERERTIEQCGDIRRRMSLSQFDFEYATAYAKRCFRDQKNKTDIVLGKLPKRKKNESKERYAKRLDKAISLRRYVPVDTLAYDAVGYAFMRWWKSYGKTPIELCILGGVRDVFRAERSKSVRPNGSLERAKNPNFRYVHNELSTARENGDTYIHAHPIEHLDIPNDASEQIRKAIHVLMNGGNASDVARAVNVSRQRGSKIVQELREVIGTNETGSENTIPQKPKQEPRSTGKDCRGNVPYSRLQKNNYSTFDYSDNGILLTVG